jgi:hypothetical protein
VPGLVGALRLAQDEVLARQDLVGQQVRGVELEGALGRARDAFVQLAEIVLVLAEVEGIPPAVARLGVERVERVLSTIPARRGETLPYSSCASDPRPCLCR